MLAANPRTDLVAPVRVVFTVGGAPPGARLLAVTRIQRPDGPGWNPRDPVALPGPGRAEFDLALLPAGDHEMSLIAWAPDATAKPVSVRLPAVTIHPDPGCSAGLAGRSAADRGDVLGVEQGFATEQAG